MTWDTYMGWLWKDAQIRLILALAGIVIVFCWYGIKKLMGK